MTHSSTIGLGLCGILLFASVAAAQQPTPRAADTPGDDTVAITIALQAGGESYRFTGRATCTHEPNGYIYSVPAQLWSIAQRDATRGVSLAFWRPANGSGEMFTLHLQRGGRTYAASTVKTKDGGSPKGSGAVTFVPAGAGGTFTVNATAANGSNVSGTITCDGFRAVVVEGGF